MLIFSCLSLLIGPGEYAIHGVSKVRAIAGSMTTGSSVSPWLPSISTLVTLVKRLQAQFVNIYGRRLIF